MPRLAALLVLAGLAAVALSRRRAAAPTVRFDEITPAMWTLLLVPPASQSLH